MTKQDILKRFSTFTSNKKKVIPTLTDDWEFTFECGYNQTFINLISNNLGQTIIKISPQTFYNDLIANNIETKGGKIIGEYAITAYKELASVKDFGQYQSILEEDASKEIAREDLIEGTNYTTNDGKVLYIGARHIQTVSIQRNNLVLSKIKKSKMIYNYETKEFSVLCKNDVFLEKLNSMSQSAVDEFIKPKIIRSKYVFMKRDTPILDQIQYKVVSGQIYLGYERGLYIYNGHLVLVQGNYIKHTKIKDFYRNFNELNNSSAEYYYRSKFKDMFYGNSQAEKTISIDEPV